MKFPAKYYKNPFEENPSYTKPRWEISKFLETKKKNKSKTKKNNNIES